MPNVRHDGTVDVHVPKGVSVLKTQDGTDTVDVHYYAGDPNGNVAADIGSLTLDVTNGTPWYKTTDTVNTGWVQVDITPAADSSITEGALATAGSDRTVDMDGNNLSFDNVNAFVLTVANGLQLYGDQAIFGTGANSGFLQLYDSDDSQYAAFTVPSSMSSYILTLPAGPPASNGQFMSFTTGGVATFADLPEDTSITSGTLASASGARNVPLDSNSLTFSDVNGFTVTLDNAAATQFTTDTFTISASTGGTKPSLTLSGITGTTSIAAANAPTAYTITLPSGAPASNGQIMSFTTAGVASFIDPPDTSITQGTLPAATGARDVDLDGNILRFQNVGSMSVNASTSVGITSSFFSLQGAGASAAILALFDGNNSNEVYIMPPTDVTSTYTWTLPPAGPSANDQVMSFTSTGVASFVDFVDANITEGTLIPATEDRTVNMGGWDLNFTNTAVIDVSNGALTPSEIRIKEDSDNGVNFIGVTVPSAITTSITYVLPEGPVANGQVLQANTDGTMSWRTLNAPMHLEGNLDVGGGATFSSPAGEDEGSWYIITNAAAAGTTFGTGGPKVFTGDSVVVKDGVASTTLDDGTQWLQIDSGTDVTSVQVGTSGVASTGAVVISDASDTAVGVVELATTAETLAGSDTTRAITSAGLDAKVSSYSTTYPPAPVGAGGDTVITHNLGSREVNVTVYDFASKQQVIPEISFTSTNTITISHALATSADEFTVHVTRVVKQ